LNILSGSGNSESSDELKQLSAAKKEIEDLMKVRLDELNEVNLRVQQEQRRLDELRSELETKIKDSVQSAVDNHFAWLANSPKSKKRNSSDG